MPHTLTADDKKALRSMPEAVHYPDRSKKFNFQDSEVISFIQNELSTPNLQDAIRTFEKARRAKLIVFDPTTKVWMGADLMQPAT